MMPVVLMMTTMVTVTMTMMVMVMVINLKQHVVSQFRDNEPHLARLEVEQGGFVADLNFRILFMICFNGKRRTCPNKGGRLASRPWILNLVPQMFDVISTIRPWNQCSLKYHYNTKVQHSNYFSPNVWRDFHHSTLKSMVERISHYNTKVQTTFPCIWPWNSKGSKTLFTKCLTWFGPETIFYFKEYSSTEITDLKFKSKFEGRICYGELNLFRQSIEVVHFLIAKVPEVVRLVSPPPTSST